MTWKKKKFIMNNSNNNNTILFIIILFLFLNLCVGDINNELRNEQTAIKMKEKYGKFSQFDLSIYDVNAGGLTSFTDIKVQTLISI